MAGNMEEAKLLRLFDVTRRHPSISSDRAAIICIADIYIEKGALSDLGRDAFTRRLQRLVKRREDAHRAFPTMRPKATRVP